MASLPVIIAICYVHLFVLGSAMIPSVEEYFPDLAGDVTRLEWLHAVNSRSLLDKALVDSSVHMLEADVVYGTLLNGSGPMPVMGHPPANTSDLSLQEFVQAVVDNQAVHKQGIKLDFKFDEAYNASWDILDQMKLTFPVWLNADILKGPGNPTAKPLDPKNFVSSAKEHLPDSTLSLGWTTAYPGQPDYYSKEMLGEMLTIIKDETIQQPITLAVRATYAAHTTTPIQQLVESIDEFQNKNQTTITIWMSSTTDDVDIPKLRTLLGSLGKSKVFLDVPANIRKQLLQGNTSPVAAAQGALVAVLSSVTVAFSKIGNIF